MISLHFLGLFDRGVDSGQCLAKLVTRLRETGITRVVVTVDAVVAGHTDLLCVVQCTITTCIGHYCHVEFMHRIAWLLSRYVQAIDHDAIDTDRIRSGKRAAPSEA